MNFVKEGVASFVAHAGANLGFAVQYFMTSLML